MGNRILKESICTSADIDAMGWFTEVFYYRLLVNCDDYGRMDGRSAILRAKLFPLRDDITQADIEAAVEALEALGCLARYTVSGAPYVRLPAWAKHQRIRQVREKYPPPPDDPSTPPDPAKAGAFLSGPCGPPPQTAAACRPNPIQSESTSESQSEAEPASSHTSSIPSAPTVQAAATAMGMPSTPRDIQTVRELAATYPEPWLLEALSRTADGPSRTWRYVRGILKRWQAAGGIDPPGKPAKAAGYSQREYSREELNALFDPI